MAQKTTSDKLAEGRSLVEGAFRRLIRKLLYPILMRLTGFKVPYMIHYQNEMEVLPGHPIIFAANHSAFSDTPLALKSMKRHGYLLLGKQRLDWVDELFFNISGCIWVDRMDKGDMRVAKEAILKYLKGVPVLWFPEGTWNLTDNLPMLPMKWGIIDVARQADAQIIPIMLDYKRKKRICDVRYGMPLVPSENMSNAIGICLLRDSLATMRWLQWEKVGTEERKNLDKEKCRIELMHAVEEYPMLQWEYERKCIFHPYPEADEVFEFLDRLIPSRENAFLLREMYKRKKILR